MPMVVMELSYEFSIESINEELETIVYTDTVKKVHRIPIPDGFIRLMEVYRDLGTAPKLMITLRGYKEFSVEDLGLNGGD